MMHMRKVSKFHRLGHNQRKILVLLAGGLGLMVARTPRQYSKVISGVSSEWKKINYQARKIAIDNLYKSKLVEWRDNIDGTATLVLTDKGKNKVLAFDIDSMEIKKPARWDRKWRLVLFDIPEKRKPAREALRGALKRLGFYEFQKSVFINPFDCQDEFDYIVEFFKVRPYVRLVTAISFDNELHLREIYHLP